MSLTYKIIITVISLTGFLGLVRYMYIKYVIAQAKQESEQLMVKILQKKGEVKSDKELLKNLDDDYCNKLAEYRAWKDKHNRK